MLYKERKRYWSISGVCTSEPYCIHMGRQDMAGDKKPMAVSDRLCPPGVHGPVVQSAYLPLAIEQSRMEEVLQQCEPEPRAIRTTFP